MPGTDGIQATRTILAEAGESPPRILILTTFDLDEYVYDALRAGATGFILKDVPPEHLVAAVRTARTGDALFSPTITRRLVETFTAGGHVRRDDNALAVLRDREIEVFERLARGRSNRDIASKLFLAETTVKSHVARIFTKLELRDRVQAVIYDYEHGLIRVGDEAN